MLCSTSSSSLSIPNLCQWLPLPRRSSLQTRTSILLPSFSSSILHFPSLLTHRQRLNPNAIGRNSSSSAKPSENPQTAPQQQQKDEEVEVEVEEDLPWIQDKALDLVEFTGSVTQKIPGPRVGQTSLPWILALAFTYVGVSFVIAVFKTVKKFNSPRAKRRQLVNQNATLIKSIDELLKKGREELAHSSLQDLVKKTGFDMEEILRKYIRYALNEKPFNGDLVADLIQLRKASMLTDSQVAEVLNEISRRIVKDKGPVVMDASGYSEKGFKRKLAVQALFGKVFYLSELPEFCSRDSSLIVKEIFGVTDEDADKLRIQTLSDLGDLETLERMVEDGPGVGDPQMFEDRSDDVGFDDIGDSNE